MNAMLKGEVDDISGILEEVRKVGISFLDKLNEVPTSRADIKVNFSDLSEEGIGTRATLDFFLEYCEKLIVASAGPRYWGYVVGGVTPAALAGDWLTSVFDQNTQSTQGHGDVSAIIELQTIKMFIELFGLPPEFSGGFVTGATMANFTGLAVARQWAGNKIGKDIARQGMTGELVVLAATPHSSVIKSLSMLGFGSNNIVKIKTEPNRERIDLQDLEAKLIQYQGSPVILNCSAGTVNTVDFDDMIAISALKKKYSFWMHVDAAFGGFAACSENYKNLTNGWEHADSITIDCHKWMNVPYDSAVILTRKEHQQLQVQAFQNSNAPYLGDPSENFSFLNFLPENSRRFRALPAWFSLMAYGREGFKSMVENSIQRADYFLRYLEESEYFDVVAPVHLNVVCFAPKDRSLTTRFLSALNSGGKVFMTPTVVNDQLCIRAAFVNFRTEEEDIRIASEEMEAVIKHF